MDDLDTKKKETSECIQVVVRCRPLNRKEKEEKCASIVDIDPKSRQLTVRHPQSSNRPSTPAKASHHTDGHNPSDSKMFTFDGVFDENTLQKYFYEEACFPLVENVLEGFNATIFAYGQTGSGKSWTMQGDASNADLRGVMPNAFSHIFEYIKGTKGVQFLIRCSYLEIYNEEIKDLLCHHDKAHTIKYDIRDDPQKGVYVQNLTNVVVDTEEQMMAQLEKGLQWRTVAETLMNDKSSRSHSIFTIIIEMSTKDETGKEHVKVGKLNLVDLAGSERQKKTGAVGKVLKEGAKINLSLLTLGCVISALADGKSKHVQYRDSKLTRLLQDSLGGNTKTCMVAAISPAESNYDETVSTLRYANNAKNIKNKPKINEDPKDAMIRAFKEEIERLKKLLMSQSGSMPGMGINEMMAAAAEAHALVTQQSVSQPRINAKSLLEEDGVAEDEALRENVSKDTPTTASPPVEAANANGEIVDMLNNERNLALEALKAKESEIEQERRLREELNMRLQELQNMVMGQNDKTDEVKEEQKLSPEEIEALEKAEAERLEAERIHKERKLRARKRREQLDKEDLTYVLEEKKAVEDELDELRQSLAVNMEEKDKYIDAIEKKVNRVRRKLEKKLQNTQMELDGLKDDFEYQREQLLDAVKDEERNSSLYLAICTSLLGEKELNKLLERCRYDDNDGEWIVPHVKVKSQDSRPMSTRKNKGSSSVPELSSPGSSLLGPLPTILPDNKTPQKYPNAIQTSQYTDSSLPPVALKSTRNSPTRQGIASRVSESRSDGYSQGLDVQASTKDGKKKKNKKKQVDTTDEPLPDEAGDGMFAGPLSDWGFAEINVNGGNANNKSNNHAPSQYSDDEFEEEDNSPTKKTPSKKKRKQKKRSENDNANNDDSLVPINGRKSSLPVSSAKVMSVSTSLPQI